MTKTTYYREKMDCSAEVQMVRITLIFCFIAMMNKRFQFLGVPTAKQLRRRTYLLRSSFCRGHFLFMGEMVE